MMNRLLTFNIANNSKIIGTAVKIEKKVSLFSSLYEEEYKVLIRRLV